MELTSNLSSSHGRLVGNALKKAIAQINEFGKPGIAAAFYFNPPEVGALKLQLPKVFERETEKYRHLMGVLVFPAQNILKYIQPIWISNPYAGFDANEYGLPSALVDTLNPKM